jgi:Mn-dependent DtxR family transcriptional regulator
MIHANDERGNGSPYMKLTPTLENCIKTIIKLDPSGYGIKSVEIAEALGITKPSVCRLVKSLQEKELVMRNGNLEVILTSEGRRQANHLIGKYDIIRRYLIEELGVDAKVATQDACNMEHIISPDCLTSISRILETRCSD